MFRRRGSRRRQNQSATAAILFVVALVLIVMLVRSTLGVWVAALLLVAALAYGRRAVSRQVIFDHNWHALEGLRTLSGVEFEHHVAELYRRLGYQVQVTRGGGDQGIDVIAQSPRERIGIQCKQWSDVVSNAGVQEAIAGRAFYNCSHAAVVCTSTYTRAARELAERAGVQLIDGAAYAAMVNQFRPVAPPSGVAAWMPRGRAVVFQVGLLAFALVVFGLHFALQGMATGPILQLASNPRYYEPPAVTSAPYQPNNATQSESFADTVGRFYFDLNNREYPGAYSLLSASFRRSAPYSKWLDGYSDTLVASPRIAASSDPAYVSLVVTAQERTRSGTGTQLTVYSGALRGIQTPSGSWLIDSGYLHTVSRVRQ